MHRRTIVAAILGSALLLHGCVKFRNEVDANREIRIIDVSPTADALTGVRQKFSVMLSDSDNRPGQLRVYAKVDKDVQTRCQYDPNPTNTIDASRQETIFRCTVDTAALPAGEHTVTYWIVDRDDKHRAERSRRFVHDNEGPKVTVDTGAFDGALHLAWDTTNAADFAEMGVYVYGVRVFSSVAAKGEAYLEPQALGGAAEIELRTYDRVKNATSQIVSIP